MLRLRQVMQPVQSGVLTFLTRSLIGMVMITLGYGIYYLVTGQPLPFVPGVPDVPLLGQAVKAIPPRYVFAMHGVSAPRGVALSPKGDRVYATEAEGERMVRVFDKDGKLLASLAPPETGPGTRLPVYVAVDGNNKVYVTDRLRKVIDVYAPDHAYLGVFLPEDQAELASDPLGITVGPQGRLYLTDVSVGNHRVVAFDDQGRFQMAFGSEGKGEGEFEYPNALVLDEQGRIFVSDGNNGRVQIFAADGTSKGGFAEAGGESLGLPRGLALDKLGRLHVVDTAGGKVNVYDVSKDLAKFLYSFGLPGMEDGQLNYPIGIAVDNSAGRAYVADRANHRVTVWAY